VTAHVYHTPFNPPNGITVVIATVGGHAENVDAVANAYLPHGIYVQHNDELLYTG
jgi:hypothetical protein